MKKRALLISCFNWYKGRLDSVRDVLIDKGYDVKVLIADFDHIRKTSIQKKYTECTYVKVPEYRNNLSISRMRSHIVFGQWAKRFLKNYQPDLIYLQIPPNNTAVHCLRYKRSNPQTKYLIDLIDLWPESVPLGKLLQMPPAWIWKKIRDDSLKAADHVFAECMLYQKRLKNVLDPNRTSTLYLYKEQSEEERELVKELVKKRTVTEKCLSFAYLGSINNIVDIDNICRVLNECCNVGIKVTIEIIGDGESRREFLKRAEAAGADVHYHGVVYDEIEKIKILTPCDYAFNMMKKTVAVGLTIKSIDYLSYGLPLINNIKGDTWKMVEEEGVGVNYKMGYETSDFLRILLEMKTDEVRAYDVYLKHFTRQKFIYDLKKRIQI